MKHDEKLIEKIADEVQEEYKMGGLANGIYLDFAKDVSKRYADQLNLYVSVEQSAWLMVNTSLEIDQIIDFKEHFQRLNQK